MQNWSTFIKITLTGLTPIFITLFFILFWSTLTICFKRFRRTVFRNIIVSAILIMFLLHPTITSSVFSLFKCYEFDGQVRRLSIDMQFECWGKDHKYFTIAVGIPILLIWVVGIPLTGLTILVLNWKRLSDPIFMKKFIALYQGLWDWAFYWEFVNTFRKIILITINLAIPSSVNYMKSLTGVIFLFLL